MSNPTRYYVYVLFRPWDGSPFYVGKGSHSRWRVHQRSKSHRNKRMQAIFERSRKLNLEVPAVKIRVRLTESEAFSTEAAIIAALGRGRHKTLVNLTDGGEGASNPSVATRWKRGTSTRGKPRSPETRAKISAALKGHQLSEETRLKISIKSKAMWADPEMRTRLSATNKGRKRSEEFRARVSAFHKGKTRSPETRAKISAAQLRRYGGKVASTLTSPTDTASANC